MQQKMVLSYITNIRVLVQTYGRRRYAFNK